MDFTQTRRFGRLLNLLLLFMLLFHLTSATTQAQVHSSLEEVIVAVNPGNPPFVSETSEGQFVGFSIDLLRNLTRLAGLKVVYEKAPFPSLLPGVATQLYDAAISCIFVSEERQQLVNFTSSYFHTGYVLVVPAGSPIKRPADLTAAMKVGILEGAKDNDTLRQLVPAQRVQTLTMVDALNQAASGVTNGAIVDELMAAFYIQQHPEAQLRMIEGLLTREQCAIAVNKRENNLLLQLNQSLTRFKNSGQFDALYAKWFGNRPQNAKILTPSAASTNPTTTVRNAPMQQLAQQLAGVYYLTLQPPNNRQGSTPTYQIVTLTADGLWVANEATQAISVPTPSLLPTNSIFAENQLKQQQGVWRATNEGQLTATILLFQQVTEPFTGTVQLPPTPNITNPIQAATPPTQTTPISIASTTTTILRVEYTLTIEQNGQVTGQYQQSQFPLGTNPTDPAAKPNQVQTGPVSGNRLK